MAYCHKLFTQVARSMYWNEYIPFILLDLIAPLGKIHGRFWKKNRTCRRFAPVVVVFWFQTPFFRNLSEVCYQKCSFSKPSHFRTIPYLLLFLRMSNIKILSGVMEPEILKEHVGFADYLFPLWFSFLAPRLHMRGSFLFQYISVPTSHFSQLCGTEISAILNKLTSYRE